MRVPLEKPGTPAELVLAHHGVKGMHWGVRRNRDASGETRKPMSRKKKVAIGVGVVSGVALIGGAAFVAYKLHKNGKLPMSSIKKKKGPKVYKYIDDIPKNIKVTEAMKKSRTMDRERYIQLMMSSKKHAPTYEEALRIATKTYPPH